jgi:hypothetical protein
MDPYCKVHIHVPRMRTCVALDLPSRMGKVKVEQPKNNHIFIPALPYTLFLKGLSSKMVPAEIRLVRLVFKSAIKNKEAL